MAVVEDGELLAELRLASDLVHSSRLLPAIDFLVSRLRGGLEAVSGFAVAVGPGSFTGLRTGISTVQGLALGLPRPCLGVSALDLLAERARGASGRLVAVVDAWRDEVYSALYDDAARPLEPPRVEAPELLARRVPAGAAYIGSGAVRYRERIRGVDASARFPERSLFLAGTLARLAEGRLARGEGHGPEALRPLYVRDAGAAPPAR